MPDNLTLVKEFIEKFAGEDFSNEDDRIYLIEFLKRYKNYPLKVIDNETNTERKMKVPDLFELTYLDLSNINLDAPIFLMYNEDKTKVRIQASCSSGGYWLWNLKDFRHYHKGTYEEIEMDLYELDIETPFIKFVEKELPNLFLEGFYIEEVIDNA